MGEILPGAIFESRSTSDNPLQSFQDFLESPISPCCYSGMGYFGISKNLLLLLHDLLKSPVTPCCYSINFLGSPISPCCGSRMGFFWDLQYPLAFTPGFVWELQQPLAVIPELSGDL